MVYIVLMISRSLSRLITTGTRATLASAGAVVVCLSVVCLSQVGVLLKRLNVGSRKQRHTIAQGLKFSDAKNLVKTQTGSLPTEAPNAGGVG